jgi:hypothetical protein
VPPIVEEYRTLLSLDQDSRRQWLQDRFPGGAQIRWWLTVIDYARFDKNFDAGVALVELAVESGDLQVFDAVEELARLASLTLSSAAQDIPTVMEPDNIARRFLATVPLTFEESVAAANRRNDEILNDPESAILTGEDSPLSFLPDDREIDLLTKVESTLDRMRPLIDHFKNREVARKIDSWFALKEQWKISERAAEVARQQLHRSLNPQDGAEVGRDEGLHHDYTN